MLSLIHISCTSGVIGEDIEGAVAEVQPDVKATIVPVHCLSLIHI